MPGTSTPINEKKSPAPAGEIAFDGWAQQQIRQDELSAQSAADYKYLWMAYLGWCTDHALAWDALKAPDLRKFLDAPAPGKGTGRRRSIHPAKMAAYTRQRYWRLLFGVYAYASRTCLISHNPTLDVEQDDRPSIGAADRQSQVLEPFVFVQLADPARIATLFPAHTEANWWHARDRAMLAVLVETGITVAELIALRGVDLVETGQGRALASPNTQASLFAEPGDGALTVDIMETRVNVGRSLEIRGDYVPLLRDWLQWRQRLLTERCAFSVPLSQRAEVMARHDRDGPLFVARRARAGRAELPPMVAASVYHSVSQALTRLRALENLPAEHHVAKGAAVVRNTVIRRWIDQHRPMEAVGRAGLRSLDSLRLR